ncbi:MAG: GGDEF domain-containing protein [Methanobacteriota archaeon]|nr:MAG: GGDEF domain-containing protein [Euryarchaeota archaeon]
MLGIIVEKAMGMVIKRLHRCSKAFLIILGFLFTLFIGIARYLTGPEWSVSLFYLFPIFMVTWFAGREAGILISIISTLSWLAADLLMIHSFSSSLVPYLNEAFRLITFLVITFILSGLKDALENQKNLAMTDPLTGIANRRAFLELASIEINRARRFKRPFSLMYMDIDDFKIINDSFGHAIGDILLRKVAETIKNNTRAIDITARLGGDEFAILLPETGVGSSYAVACKLRTELSALAQENGWPATFSIGVITFNRIPSNIDEATKKVDLLMYSGKQAGKNAIKREVIN